MVSELDLGEESANRGVVVFTYGQNRLYAVSVRTVYEMIFNCEANGSNEATVKYLNEQMPFLMSDRDLIAGHYEGGFKVWESTEDLIEHLCTLTDKSMGKVLDLGCGAGLAGIAALLKGANHVHFADFNSQVLQWFTLPNVILNLLRNVETLSDAMSIISNSCVFLSGDWDDLNQYVQMEQPNSYDYIISAETIYSTANYPKLLSVIKRNLSRTGKAIIAAKSHYFGVGGSTFEFERFVMDDGEMRCSTVKQIEASVCREILELEWNSK